MSEPVDIRMQRASVWAGRLVAVQSLVLAALAVLYVVELVRGEGADRTRVVMSAVLIAVFAGGLGYLARAWLIGHRWPRTPTVMWSVLLLPVAWGLVTGSARVLGIALFVLSVGTAAAAMLAGPDREPD